MKHNDLIIQKQVVQAIAQNYAINISFVEFVPVGEASFAYIITSSDGSKYFAKYCQQSDVIKNIARVNSLLIYLIHLPFVVPPIVSNGQTSSVAGTGMVYVYPYIQGEVVRMGNDKFDRELVGELTKIMATIHTSNPSVDLPVESFVNDFTSRLEALIKATNEGLFDNQVKQLLIDNEGLIRQIINKHNEIGNKYSAQKPKFVLTHGDITGLNIIQSKEGIKLVDWDGAMFAPAERDFNFLFDNPFFSVDEYLSLTGQTHYEPDLIDYYGQDWALNSIIGNFESILTNDKAKGSESEYIDEINEYLGFYK